MSEMRVIAEWYYSGAPANAAGRGDYRLTAPLFGFGSWKLEVRRTSRADSLGESASYWEPVNINATAVDGNGKFWSASEILGAGMLHLASLLQAKEVTP